MIRACIAAVLVLLTGSFTRVLGVEHPCAIVNWNVQEFPNSVRVPPGGCVTFQWLGEHGLSRVTNNNCDFDGAYTLVEARNGGEYTWEVPDKGHAKVAYFADPLHCPPQTIRIFITEDLIEASDGGDDD